MYYSWGTFYQDGGLNVREVLQTAQDSLVARGYSILLPVNNGFYYTVIGQLQDWSVMVQVTALSDGSGTYVIVTAYSNDSQATGGAVSGIRSDIQESHTIDGGSAGNPVSNIQSVRVTNEGSVNEGSAGAP